jgi:hypothetical protein
LLYGDSGMGKTMAIEKFKRLHPPSYDHKAGITKSPVVIVNMPSSPKERRFFARLLDALHAPFSPSEGLIALETLAKRVLRRVEPKILIIDEAHDLLAGSYRDQRCALNLLKGLANDLKIPVVAVGTEDARHAIQTDPQVASRFDPLHLVDGRNRMPFVTLWLRSANCCPCVKPLPSANGKWFDYCSIAAKESPAAQRA